MLPPFKLERYFARYEFTVRHLLCASDCESVTVGNLLALEPEAAERLNRLWLGYTEAPGAPSLRREIAAVYDSIAPEEVLVHSGAQEAIFLLMQALLGEGDHVIVHWPCYQSLLEVARSSGHPFSLWQAREENGWRLDIDELRTLVRPNTRAIVLNTPHNPTGSHLTAEELHRVVAIAQDCGASLLVDEVYRGSEYDESQLLPAACDCGPSTVSIGVMSKTYGLAGLRIGWIATHDEKLLRRVAALKDYTTICNSAPAELLAEIALRNRKQLVQRNRAIILKNLALLDDFFARHADRFSWQRPQAGPIAFPKLLGEAVEPFCEKLARNAGVLLLPGTVYEDTGNHLRIGFGRHSMPAALKALEDYLEKE